MSFVTTAQARVDLAPFDAEALQEEPATVYALSPDLRIEYVNGAWTKFALANGARWSAAAWGIGCSVLDAAPSVLRPFYERLYQRALTERVVLEHDYECSSATTARHFRMRLLPRTSGGLVVVHSLRHSAEHPDCAPALLDSAYRRLGMISQCAHCRRVERANERGTWDWVPSYVEHPPPMTSHGLCRLCVDYYYSDGAVRDG